MARIVTFLFIGVLSHSDALGCTCAGSPPVEDLFTNYEHIFVARITGGTIETEPNSRLELVIAQYEVVETIKGESSEIRIATEASGELATTCSVQLRIGAHYLIFADSTKRVSVNLCHPSKRPISYRDNAVDSAVLTLRELARAAAN